MFVNNSQLESIIILLLTWPFSESASIYELVLYNLATCPCNTSANLDVSRVKIYTYNFETRTNNMYYLNEAANGIISNSEFNPRQCIHIFVTGYHNNNDNAPSVISRCIFSNIDCNGIKPLGIVVDHSAYTNTGNVVEVFDYLGVYKRSFKYAKSIGIGVGLLVAKLFTFVGKEKINIIGHSLGGHIIGRVGETVQKVTGQRLKSLYAADPAGPCFDFCPDEHLKSGQADVVIAFHCNAGGLGTNLNVADYDFYSRDGVTQDTCYGGGTPDLFFSMTASFCSHGKCVPIVHQSAIRKSTWNALKCSSSNDFFSGKCKNNEVTTAGYNVIPNTSPGTYFFFPKGKLICDADD